MKKILSLFYFLILCLNMNSVNAKNTLLKVQLQWFDQSQFAGFYVAQSRQYFEKEDLRKKSLEQIEYFESLITNEM